MLFFKCKLFNEVILLVVFEISKPKNLGGFLADLSRQINNLQKFDAKLSNVIFLDKNKEIKQVTLPKHPLVYVHT